VTVAYAVKVAHDRDPAAAVQAGLRVASISGDRDEAIPSTVLA
jgi:hypothetical protein